MCFSVMAERDLKKLQKEFGAEIDIDAFTLFDERSQRDPKRFPPIRDQIWPKDYGVVLHKVGESLQLSPMRYGIYEPVGTPAHKAAAYNARKNSLGIDYWSEAFGINHGLMIVTGRFWESVVVKDLIRAGVVQLDEINARFEREAEKRKLRVLGKGKKYAPTKTEKEPILERSIKIEFEALDNARLLAPVVFSRRILDDRREDLGCAIVTDVPHQDIRAAGHDRTPIFLMEKSAMHWLNPQNYEVSSLRHLLTQRPNLSFTHRLPMLNGA